MQSPKPNATVSEKQSSFMFNAAIIILIITKNMSQVMTLTLTFRGHNVTGHVTTGLAIYGLLWVVNGYGPLKVMV